MLSAYDAEPELGFPNPSTGSQITKSVRDVVESPSRAKGTRWLIWGSDWAHRPRKSRRRTRPLPPCQGMDTEIPRPELSRWQLVSTGPR